MTACPRRPSSRARNHCLRFTSGFSSLGPGPSRSTATPALTIAPNGGPPVPGRLSQQRDLFHPPRGHLPVPRDPCALPRDRHRPVPAVPGDFTGHLGAPQAVLKEGFCLGDIRCTTGTRCAAPMGTQAADNCEPTSGPNGSWRSTRGSTQAGRLVQVADVGPVRQLQQQPGRPLRAPGDGNPYHYLLEADSATTPTTSPNVLPGDG